MRRGGPRRRLRVRRKRKGKSLASEVGEATGNAGVEVVGEWGCLVVESVISASVVLALLTVPAYLLTG